MAFSQSAIAGQSLASFAIGTTLYWTYFHRYEVHMYPLRFLYMFLAACGILLVIETKGLGIAGLGATAALAGGFLLGGYGNCLLWRLFFNPLNKFPGPFPARISSLWFSTQLGKSDGHLKLQELHKKYGKYVRVGSNDLSITDPGIMEMAYGSQAKTTKAEWYDGEHPLVSMQLSRDKGLHDRRRRIWAPAFSEKAIREYEETVAGFNDKFISRMGGTVNATYWFNLYAFDVMGALAFGKQYDMLTTGRPEEIDLLAESLTIAAYRLPAWLFRTIVTIPGLAGGYKRFIVFCKEQLASRVQRRENDIMSWLLKAYENVQHPEEDLMLQADSRLIIAAGSGTTGAALTALFYHLAQRPDIVDKLRKELPGWKHADIRNSEFLNGCINESLRLHPPVPSGLFRLAPPEGIQVGEVHIPGKTMFFCPMYAMGRDPDNYNNPDEFRPERWGTESEKVGNKEAFAPFSIGPYGCIGKGLALLEIRTLTARIVNAFDVKFADGEDGSRFLTKSKDRFGMDFADLDLVFMPRQ